MEITKLTSQAHNPERVNLYVDGQFYRGLDRLVAIKLGLRPGLTLTPTLLGRLESTQQENTAWEWALRSLRISPKSQRDMQLKLARKYDAGTAADLITRLVGAGLVDDTRLAEQLVDRWQQRAAMSRREMLLKLWQKGIEKEVAQSAMAMTGDDLTTVVKLACQKNGQLPTDLSWRERFNKIAGYLARKGFAIADIKRAVTEDNLKRDTQ